MDINNRKRLNEEVYTQNITLPTVEVDVDVEDVDVKLSCGETTDNCGVDDSQTIDDITISRCVDIYSHPSQDIVLQGAGRILRLRLNIKNVCPNKMVAVAVRLFEINQSGSSINRGLKTYAVKHTGDPRYCRDILLRNITFVLPECLDVSGSTDYAMELEKMNRYSTCNSRNFKAEVLAHYIDVTEDYCKLD